MPEEPAAPEKTPQEEQAREEAAQPHPVSSSMLSEISYDEEGEILSVVFQNGREEEYPATKEQWEGLLNAPSKGKFMWSEIL